MAADFLRLCKNPLKDLKRWLTEDKKQGDRSWAVFHNQTKQGQTHADSARTTIVVAKAGGIRTDALHELRGGMDTAIDGRRVDSVPARPRASAHTGHLLRQIRGQGKGLTAPVQVDAGLPDQALRELLAVRTPADKLAWQIRWAEHLSGRMAEQRRAEMQPERPRGQGLRLRAGRAQH